MSEREIQVYCRWVVERSTRREQGEEDRTQVERMAGAFEHEDLEHALRLAEGPDC